MASESTRPPKPWIETPCIYSAPLSREAGCNIYLKLENLQPSGSFKSRGIGNLMHRAAAAAAATTTTASGPSDQPLLHFYSSSGGNAGLACATAANTLRRGPATVVVPRSTPPHMVGKLRALGAAVVQAGDNWAAADAHLREAVIPAFERENGPPARAVYVAPFDHRDVWDGAETMVAELGRQMAEGFGRARKIDGILCSVGGGGLLCGIMQGVQKLKEKGGGGAPKVLAVETKGGDSLNASVVAGELVTLPGITTIATSLGAVRVAEEAYAWTQRAGDDLISVVVSDEEAVMAMERFLDDSRMLVESACSATIATVYNGDVARHLGKGLSETDWAAKNIVVIVCGGSNISLSMLEKYKEQFGL